MEIRRDRDRVGRNKGRTKNERDKVMDEITGEKKRGVRGTR